jgi:hypothetical protein
MFGAGDQRRQQQQQQQQAQMQAQLQAAQEAAQRAQEQADAAANYRLQAASVGIDTSTYAGALQGQEINFQSQRLEAAKIGGDAIIAEQELEEAQSLALQKEWAEKIAQLKQSYADREFAALNDTSTVAGQLAAYDRQAAEERADSIKTYGRVFVQLEQAQAAERAKIIKDAVQTETDYYKGLQNTIDQFVQSTQFGSLSPLSPAEQFLAARNQYQQQLSLALQGDRTAQGGITQIAQTLLEQARNYLGPSTSYGDLVSKVTSELSAMPIVAASNDPQVKELQNLGSDYLAPMMDALKQSSSVQSLVASLTAKSNDLLADNTDEIASMRLDFKTEIQKLLLVVGGR